MARRPTTALLTSAALVVALSACGSDDEGPEPLESDSPAAETGEPDESDSDDATDESDAAEEDADAGDDEADWVVLTDEPSGTTFALPERVDPEENSATISDGSSVQLRNYSAMATSGEIEVGFNVIDTPGEQYSFEAGVDGVANTLGGEVISTNEIEVSGHDAVDVEMAYGGDYIVFFQLITTDDHILQALASGPEAERDVVEEAYQQLGDSLEVH